MPQYSGFGLGGEVLWFAGFDCQEADGVEAQPRDHSEKEKDLEVGHEHSGDQR